MPPPRALQQAEGEPNLSRLWPSGLLGATGPTFPQSQPPFKGPLLSHQLFAVETFRMKSLC